MIQFKHIIAVLLSLAFLLPSAIHAAPTYQVIDLGTLGGNRSSGRAINASGQVTGSARVAGSSTDHVFFYDGTMHDLGPGTGSGINASGQIAGTNSNGAFMYDGSYHYLGTLGGTFGGNGQAINAQGWVTGVAHTADEHQRAYLYDGAMHNLGVLGTPGNYSEGHGINATGHVVGESSLSGSVRHAFLYDGSMHDLGTLGGSQSVAMAINDNGLVAGYSTATNEDFALFHAFLYDGTMHDLGSLGDGDTLGISINSLGQVVGRSANRAFLYDSSFEMVDLNSLIEPSLGWRLQTAFGINDSGQITGEGRIGGQTHAFLLTPVPEPSTLALGGTGLVGLALFLRGFFSFGRPTCRRSRVRGNPVAPTALCTPSLPAGVVQPSNCQKVARPPHRA